jgi:hypothetical protein
MTNRSSIPLMPMALKVNNEDFSKLMYQVDKGRCVKIYGKFNVYNSESTNQFIINCQLIISKQKVGVLMSNCVNATMAVRFKLKYQAANIVHGNVHRYIFHYEDFMKYLSMCAPSDIFIFPLLVHLTAKAHFQKQEPAVIDLTLDNEAEFEDSQNGINDPKGSCFQEPPVESIANKEEVLIEDTQNGELVAPDDDIEFVHLTENDCTHFQEQEPAVIDLTLDNEAEVKDSQNGINDPKGSRFQERPMEIIENKEEVMIEDIQNGEPVAPADDIGKKLLEFLQDNREFSSEYFNASIDVELHLIKWNSSFDKN